IRLDSVAILEPSLDRDNKRRHECTVPDDAAGSSGFERNRRGGLRPRRANRAHKITTVGFASGPRVRRCCQQPSESFASCRDLLAPFPFLKVAWLPDRYLAISGLS